MCTRITVPYKDSKGAVRYLVGRTMDFGSSVGETPVKVTAGSSHSAYWNPLKMGLTAGQNDFYARATKFKVGSVDIEFYPDAANKYFSVEGLWLPESTYLSSGDKLYPSQQGGVLSGLTLVQYIMGAGFNTLKDLVPKLEEYPVSIPEAKYLTHSVCIHFAITEWATGETAIVEIGTEGVAGKCKVHRNTGRGVMTNSPVYRSQIDNLRGYLGALEHANVQKATVCGIELEMTGNGENIRAMPGSPLPADRFVKASLLLDLALRKQGTDGVMPNEKAARRLVADILGQVSVIEGTTSEKNIEGATKWDTTLWTTIKSGDGSNPPIYTTRSSNAEAFAPDVYAAE